MLTFATATAATAERLGMARLKRDEPGSATSERLFAFCRAPVTVVFEEMMLVTLVVGVIVGLG
jgi:hypothetical protein